MAFNQDNYYLILKMHKHLSDKKVKITFFITVIFFISLELLSSPMKFNFYKKLKHLIY